MTLLDYLAQLPGNAWLFDVGRPIRKLDKSQFAQFEALAKPYPSPYLHHAWFAVFVAQPTNPEQETLWFLKWPLDEQGFLVPAVRDDLVNRLLALKNQQVAADSALQDPLKDNPFSFAPDQYRLASLHAEIHQLLHRPVSSYYADALAFVQSPQPNDNWQHLGLQGLADIAVRHDEFSENLARAISDMPQTPYLALAQCLENQPLSPAIQAAALKRLQKDMQENNSAALEASVRIIAASNPATGRAQAWQLLFAREQDDTGAMLAFSRAACFDLNEQRELILPFLEKLARTGGDFACFKRVMADLLFLNALRPVLLAALRSPAASEQLMLAKQQLIPGA
ncbi:MAG: DUF3549 family protein [Oceanospirillaceae bacterium]|nr:DUF3549 family protein [Oceanospirillaceae bacterium]MCP5335163.1 DUF3549 family protein [Oceanospirillaceae bacterium]MCP5351499.1 DUF3549 family protein [Oceanospirillaceae bacterium]